jgi:hypothetical protein
MKIPEKLEVAGIVYTLEDVSPDHPELDHGRLRASQVESKAKMYFRNTIEGDVRGQAFTHEMVHAVMDSLGISMCDVTIDERFVESFSQILYQVLKQL